MKYQDYVIKNGKFVGKFDLIYFTGVLYHNPEQLRFIQKLYDKLNYGGVLVLESATTRKRKLINENVVEIHDKSQIDELQGDAGTLVIFDTNVTHKAGQVLTDNKRLIIRIDTTTK